VIAALGDKLRRGRGAGTAGAWTVAQRVREAQRSADDSVLYTPDLIVARSLPCPKPGDAAETAYWDAVKLLQSEDIWLVSRWHDHQVAYLAAPGARFAPDGGLLARTPLAQALPGHPLHRGDRGYAAPLADGNVAVVVVRAGALQLSLGTEREAQVFAADRSVEMISADPGAAEEWVPYRLAQIRHRRRLGLLITASGAAAAVVAAAATVGATYWQGTLLEQRALLESQSTDYTRTLESQLADAVRQPLLLHLARMQRLRELKQVFGETAYLLRYEVTDDGRWSWTAVVPDWANAETLRRFGSGIRLSAAPGRPGALIATVSGER